MNRNDLKQNLERVVKSQWKNGRSSYNHVPRNRIEAVKNSSHNTSLSPYDDYALSFLHDAESEIKEDYKSRYSTRRWLLKGLTGYFLVMGCIIFYGLFKNDSNFLKIVLSSGFFSSFIGLLIIVFKYSFTSSDKYYDFIEKIMNWAYREHKDD